MREYLNSEVCILKKIEFDKMDDVNGAGSDIKLKPVVNTEAPTTGDAPFVPGKHGYKKNDVPENIVYPGSIK